MWSILPGAVDSERCFCKISFFVNTTHRNAVKTKHTANRVTITTVYNMTHDFIHQWSKFTPPFFSPVWLKSCARVSWWLRYYTTPEEQQTRCKLQRVENQIKEKKLRTRLLFFPLLLYLYKPQLSLHLEWNKKCSRTQKLTAFREHKIILSMQFSKKRNVIFFQLKNQKEMKNELIDHEFWHTSCALNISAAHIPCHRALKHQKWMKKWWENGPQVFLSFYYEE